jgi:hypothetical protein
MTTEIEINVVWFPPQGIHKRAARDMEHAREICAEFAKHNPLIEQRTVTYGEWIIVENLGIGQGS